MKYVLFFLSLVAMLAHNANAKVWQVNNNAGQYADFTSLIDAHNDAGVIAGDTLYVAGSNTFYNTVNLTKKLVIIGTGYFLTENAQTQAKHVSAKIAGSINFSSGSEGSIIEGMYFQAYVGINADNITVRRNYIQFPSTASIYIASSNNAAIIQNYIEGGISISTQRGEFTNAIIANNYIGGSIHSQMISNDVYHSNGIFYNNVVAYFDGLNNSTIENNILTYSSVPSTFTDCVVKNNAAVFATSLPEGNGNINGIDLADTFINTGSADGKWQLKAGSPCIGTGANGSDMGMFGGLNPYVLSGIPNIPTVYEYVVSGTGTNETGLQVTVKAKARN